MTHLLRNGTITQDTRLDRTEEFDPRSLDYRINAALDNTQQTIITKRWYPPTGTEALDQGREGACFPPEVFIRMADGSHRPISDVRLLEEVVTAEGHTGVVTQLMTRKANRGIVRVKILGHLDLRCTPEHPVLTQRGYVPAGQLVSGDRVAITRYHTPEGESLHAAQLVDLRTFRGKFGTVNTGGVTSEVATLPDFVPRTPDFGRLLGLYAAEGHTTPNKVVWSFGGHEKHTLVPETVQLIKTVFGASARVQVRPNNAINVVLYGKPLRLLFEKLVPGTSRHGDKRLSALVSAGPSDYRKALLEGWLAGDGYKRRTEWGGSSVCRALALDMHSIATAAGLRARIHESAPTMNKYAKTRQRRYEVGFGLTAGSTNSARQDDAAAWRPVRSVTPEPYEGYVYNLEVEGEHSYVADGVGVHNCTGAGITNDLRFYPVAIRGLDMKFAREQIYWTAQRNDRWPGGEYPGATPTYSGTSVLAAIKAAVNLGYYGEYRWAKTEKEMALGIGHLGPAIIGVQWYEDMFQPNTQGFLTPSGDIAGGHCILVPGINATQNYYTVYNSWGNTWGDKGYAKISRYDMTKLLANRGECCIITERYAPKN